MKDILHLDLAKRVITNTKYVAFLQDKIKEYDAEMKDFKESFGDDHELVSFDDWVERDYYKVTNEYNLKALDLVQKKELINVKYWKAPFQIPFTYYADLIFAIGDNNEPDKEPVFVNQPPLTGASLIEVHSKALGDQLAWIPIVDLFQKKHNIKVICNTPLYKFFKPFYPNISWQWNTKPVEIQTKFVLGYDVTGERTELSPIDCRTQHLQHVACNQLGIEPQELQPDYRTDCMPIIDKKYVCITECSTGQFKLWQNQQGMIDVINYLTDKGYYVVGLGTEPNILKRLIKNPSMFIDKAGKRKSGKPKTNMKELCNILQHSKAFVGLPSGLAWLSWTLHIPVVTVDGITQDFAVFKHHKVQNKNVCNGCWNDTSFVYDNSDADYCPRKKDYECTKSISGQDVIDVLKDVL